MVFWLLGRRVSLGFQTFGTIFRFSIRTRHFYNLSRACTQSVSICFEVKPVCHKISAEISFLKSHLIKLKLLCSTLNLFQPSSPFLFPVMKAHPAGDELGSPDDLQLASKVTFELKNLKNLLLKLLVRFRLRN